MPKTHVLISILTAAAVVSGCGSTSSTPTTQAALVAQADPICKQVAIKRTAANKAVAAELASPSGQLQVLAHLGPGVAADEESAMTRLRALKVPASLAHPWDHLLTGMQTLTDDAARIATDAKHGDLAAVEALTTSARKLRQQLTSLATSQGFHYCGSES